MWACNCLLCRWLVHPIIRRGASQKVTQEVTTTESVIEGVSPPSLTSAGIPQDVAPMSHQVTPPPEDVRSSPPPQPTVVEVKMPQELITRLEQMESEVSGLRKEISTLNDSIKSVVLEIKEVVAELSSPFNVLREDKLKRGNGNGGSKHNGSITSGTEDFKMAPTSFLEVLKVIYSTLDKWNKDQVLTLIDGYVKAGLISDEVGKSLISIAELADNMRRLQISVDDQILYFYSLINALNTKERSLNEYALKELLRRGKN